MRGDDFNREDETIDFDVITELVFSDRAGFVKWIEELSVEAIAADEERFLDRSRTRAYVIEERVTARLRAGVHGAAVPDVRGRLRGDR